MISKRKLSYIFSKHFKGVFNILVTTLFVYDYLLSINNEYFAKLTYIPLEDLCQNI